MKRLLAGSSLCLLLLSGCVAANAGAAFAQGTLFVPGQAKPVFSPVTSEPLPPVNSTTKPADSSRPEPVLMAGLIPTEFVATAAARITAAKTTEERLQFESYFTNYHNLLLDDVVKANPATAAEEENYLVATQMMALLKELVNYSALKRNLTKNGLSDDVLKRSFLNAQHLAKDMMGTHLLSPEERHQRFLKEQSYSQQRASLHSTIKSFPSAVMPADPGATEEAVEARIKEFRELIERQRSEITEQRLAIVQKRIAIAQKRLTPRVTYPQPPAPKEEIPGKRDRTSSSALKDTPRQAMPEFSPQDLTSPQAVKMAGMTPTQFVATVAVRIDAADAEESFEKLAEIKRYLTGSYGLVYNQFAKSNPATAAEEDRYIVTRQMLTLLEELIAACSFDENYKQWISWRINSGQRRYNRSPEDDEQYARRQRAFGRAQGIARGLEHPELLSAEERHQKFLEEKIYTDEFTRPNPSELVVIPAAPANLTGGPEAQMEKLGEVIDQQRYIIKQQSIAIVELDTEIAKQNYAIQLALRQKSLQLRVASNAGAAVAADPASAPATPALPLTSPTVRLDDPSFTEAIKMDGVSPTQFIAKISKKMFAAKSFEELQQYERYFISYYGRLYDYVATSNPATADEEDRYVIARRMMNLILKLAASSNFKPPYDQYYWTRSGQAAFVAAQSMAKGIERFEVENRAWNYSTRERHQRFLREKSDWNERARPNPLEVVVVKTDLADPANGQSTQINKLLEVIEQQRFTIDQHHFTIVQMVDEIAKHAADYRQEYNARMRAEGRQPSQTSLESPQSSLQEGNKGDKSAPRNPFEEPFNATEVKAELTELANPTNGQLTQIDELREVIKKQRVIIDKQLLTIAEQIHEVQSYDTLGAEHLRARQAIEERKALEPERLLERINDLESEIESLKNRRRR